MALELVGRQTTSGTGSLQVTLSAFSPQTGDLIIAIVNSARQGGGALPQINGSTSFLTVGGNNANCYIGTGTAGAAGGVDLGVYYHWYASGDSTVDQIDLGSYQMMCVAVVRNADPTTPFSGYDGSGGNCRVDASATQTITLPITTAPSSGQWLLHAIGLDRDASNSSYQAWSGGSVSGVLDNWVVSGASVGTGMITNAGAGGGLWVHTFNSSYAWSGSTFADSTTHAYVSLYINPASSNQDYVKTPNDPVGITDSASYDPHVANDPTGVTDSVGLDRGLATLSDPVGLTDSVTALKSQDVAQNDPVGVTDSVVLARSTSPNDPVGVTDSATLGRAPATLNDPVGVTDAVVLARSTSPNDPVGVTDSATVGSERPVNDPVGVTDAPALLMAAVRSPADPVGVTDAVTVDRGLATINDPVGVTDSVEASTGGTNYDRTPADPVGVTDSAIGLWSAVSSYPFDEGSGTTSTEAGGSGRNATVSSGSWTASGRNGAALARGGTAGIGATAAPYPTGTYTEFTVVADFYLDAASSSWQSVVQMGDSFFLEFDTVGTFDAYAKSQNATGKAVYASTNPSTGSWHRAAAAVKPTGIALTVDGTTYTDTASFNNFLIGASTFQICGGTGQQATNMRVDNVWFFDKALTAEQVAALPQAPSAGNQDYVKNPNDPVDVTDSVTIESSGLQTPNEPVGVTDAVVLSVGRTVDDPVGVTDTGTEQQIDFSQTSDDPVGVTDSVDAQLDTGGTQYDRSPSDPVGATDAVAMVLDGTRSPSDPVGVTDSVTSALDLARSADDPVGVTDSVTGLISVDRTPADPVGITDAVTLGVEVPGNDPVGGTDSVAVVIDAVRAPDDPVGISDSVSATLGAIVSPADPVGVTDSAARLIDAVRTSDDPVGVTDSAATVLDAVRGPDDPVGVSDSALTILDSVRGPSDPVGVTDSVLAEKSGTSEQSKADPVGITDSAATVVTAVRSANDPVGITDAAPFDHGLTRADNVGVTDARTIGQGKAPSDNVGVTDSVSVVKQVVRSVDDPVGITDSAASEGAGVVNVGDPVGITDSVTATLERVAILDESVGVTDAVLVTIDYHIDAADGVNLVDGVGIDRGYSLLVEDLIPVTDEAVPHNPNLFADLNDPVAVTDAVLAVLGLEREYSNLHAEIETAIRRMLLANSTVNGYVAGKVFKHRLEEPVVGTGGTAVVVARDGGWTTPDPVMTSEFPRIRMKFYADPDRDSAGLVTRANAEEKAYALFRACDRLMHRKRGVWWGRVDDDDPGLRIVISTREREPHLVDRESYAGADLLGDSMYVTCTYRMQVLH